MREPSERADGLYDELLPKLAGTMELTPRERAALGFAAGGFLMWGRLHRAFDVPASGPGYHAMLANESGGVPDSC